MKFLVYIFLFLFAKVSFAQTSIYDTIWVDSSWKEVSKKYANFYRTIKKTESGYLVTDFYLDGQPQMIAEANAVKPVVKNGKCFYYYKNNIRGSAGNYSNGKKLGVWIEYYNRGKDSSIINFLEDGTKNYIRKSKYEDVFTVVEVMPEYPNGQDEMFNFIKNNIKYPQEAFDKKWEGKSYVNFIINENGVITEPTIIKSSGYKALDDEAIRIINLMPNWKPGTQNNKKVSVTYNLPFSFKL